jgi:hypothetical protein
LINVSLHGSTQPQRKMTFGVLPLGVSLTLVALAPVPSSATVLLPKWFSNGMVLQTSEENGPPAFLAGITEPAGELVNIQGDAGEYSVTSESESGHWKVKLDASNQWKNPDNMTITVKGATGAAVVASGVQAGDVFFCSGQSNMLFSLHQALNYTAEASTLASYPNFRFFMTNRALNSSAQWDLTTDDANCDAATPPTPPGPPPPPAPPGTCAVNGFLKDTAFGKGTGPVIGTALATDAADCCTQCFNATWAAKGCSFFTFAPAARGSAAAAAGGGTCYLKNNAHGPALPRTGYVSGGHATPPPPSPPKPCNKWLTPAEASADDSAFLLSFSAVCFMTVRDIARQHTHDRPMGLIQSAWGGSRLESWMSAEALAGVGAPVAGNIPPNNNKSPNGAANDESALYNGMVAPCAC